MIKNSTLSNTLATVGKIQRDENFKDVVRYKTIAAVLIKFAIPEFREWSIEDICKTIVGKNKNEANMSKEDLLNSEAEIFATELGTKDSKHIFQDSSLRLIVNNEVLVIKFNYDEITVNMEMQNKTKESELGYNLVSRAIYYGAMVLAGTVSAGDTKYSGIHKVYSIWFCADDLNLEEYVGTECECTHRYGFRRFYDGLPGHVPTESFADLIEVVLVELNKLKVQDSKATEFVYTLFDNPIDFVNLIEKRENIKLPKVLKGVCDMIDYEERTKRREEIAKEEVKRESAISMLQGGKLAIEDIAEYTGLSLEDVRQLRAELK